MDETKKAQDLGNQLDHERVQFVMNEIALGMSFLDLADTTRSEETRERNQANARKAHDTAAVFLATETSMSAVQRSAMDAQLATLKARLDELPS